MIVNNMDCAGLIRRLRRFRYETVKAASSALANVSAADFTRAKAYLGAISSYMDWIVAQPQLDLPEWAPKSMDIGDAEKMELPDNESLYDLMTMYDILETEIGNSQSARMPSGMMSHDQVRIRSIVEKMNKFLDDYVSKTLPIDLPESSPNRAQTGPGKVGV